MMHGLRWSEAPIHLNFALRDRDALKYIGGDEPLRPLPESSQPSGETLVDASAADGLEAQNR